MAAVIVVTRPAYYAPTRRRYFFTATAAVKAEASALIRRKHPTERGDNETGDPGWYWRDMPRSDVLFRRVVRRIAITKDSAP